MIELEEGELDILGKLIFPEQLSNILEESTWPENITKDILKQLIKKGLIGTVANTASQIAPKEIYYDSDHMHSYSYIISGKGLEVLKLWNKS